MLGVWGKGEWSPTAKAVVPYDIPDFANLLHIMLRTVKKLSRVIRLISRATSASVPRPRDGGG